MVMIIGLNKVLPEPYYGSPRIHVGRLYELAVGTYAELPSPAMIEDPGNGGVAVATYAPPKPTLTSVPASAYEHDIYEVRVYDSRRNRRLLAAIEIVSPSNKDRPETRSTFIAKAAALLQHDVCVSIVDIVSTSQFNLYGELLNFLEVGDPALGEEPPPMYAATMRMRSEGKRRLMESWYDPLVLGEPLPTLPVWLKETWAIPLELEAGYEESCQTLRIR